ncbi:MAG: heterodisulfide reductase-related iron-sulfur binding cluster [Planctomycetaceae bacterium]
MSFTTIPSTFLPRVMSIESASSNDRSLGEAIPYERFLDCVHCGLCTSACPTYLETGDENDSPRGRIYLMRAVTDGRIDLTEPVARHLDLCLDCRSCETACPSGVQYGRLIEPFRVAMRQREAISPQSKPWTSRMFEKYILHGLFPDRKKLRRSLMFARLMQMLRLDKVAEVLRLDRLLPQPMQRMQRLLPKLPASPPELPEFLPAIGPRRAKVGLFLGCVADAMFRQMHWSTARVLQANGCDVVIPRSQACCGAIHYHSGHSEPAAEFARRNLASLNVAELDAVIVNVAGCGSMLKDYGHISHELTSSPSNGASSVDPFVAEMERFAGKVRDVSEFLVELGPMPPTHSVPLKGVYHDACHLCHAQQIRSQPRTLLASIPGLTLVPLEESEVCCGAAGSYNLTEPEMADRLGRRKGERILATGADAVIMGNAGCHLQIQAMLKSLGRPLPIYHPMELLEKAYYGSP